MNANDKTVCGTRQALTERETATAAWVERKAQAIAEIKAKIAARDAKHA